MNLRDFFYSKRVILIWMILHQANIFFSCLISYSPWPLRPTREAQQCDFGSDNVASKAFIMMGRHTFFLQFTILIYECCIDQKFLSTSACWNCLQNLFRIYLLLKNIITQATTRIISLDLIKTQSLSFILVLCLSIHLILITRRYYLFTATQSTLNFILNLAILRNIDFSFL